MAAKNAVGLQVSEANRRLHMAGEKKIDQLDRPLCGSTPFHELALTIH